MVDTRKIRMKITCNKNNEVVFDNTETSGELFVITKGEDAVFPKISEAVLERLPGDIFEVALEPSEAFGDYDQTAFKEIPLSMIPVENRTLGSTIVFDIKGQLCEFKLKSIHKAKAVVDVNHRLAGHSLLAAVEIVE